MTTPAGLDQRSHVTQRGGGIGLIEEYVAAHGGVEQLAAVEFLQMDLLEVHVTRAAVLRRAFTGASERLRIPIDAQDAARGAHKIGSQ